VRLSALTENLRPSLDIYADVILHPAFKPGEVELKKKQLLSDIEAEKNHPTQSAMRILPSILYGESHAYSNPFTGTGYERTVSAFTRESAAAWHRAWFHPNNATLIVTGDTTLEKVKPELERAFGSWARGEAPKKKLDTVPATRGKRVYLIDRPDAPQSVIVAAHVSELGGRPNDVAIDTVLRGFGGMATSRLNRNLRLDKHWSYGVIGGLTEARGQRPFTITAPVQTDKTKEAIVELQKELRDIAGARPVKGEEYESIMRSSTARLPGRFETLRALEVAAIQMLNYGYADDYWSSYAKNVRALGEADLDTAAKASIHPDEVVWIVVGDLKKIEPGIRELNLGEVVRVEAR
ncbi:MAG TPA: pitrilysin family protein, partial [Thermoanaerobaculia bacterium]